jgi:hypothetical protein
VINDEKKHGEEMAIDNGNIWRVRNNQKVLEKKSWKGDFPL